MDASRVQDAAGVVSAARELSPVLFAAALRTDSARLLPRENLDLLAEAGLYGAAAPVSAGGAELDPVAFATAVEWLAAGCLTTALVWLQHHTAVRALAGSANDPLRTRCLAALARGELRGGIALGGLFGARPLLHARRAGDGWLVSGESPWVSGWGRVDLLCVAARAGDHVLWALLDAAPAPTLTAEPARLVAVNASGTVTLRFRDHPVPAGRILDLPPADEVRARDAIWLNGALSLGVTARCCALLGPTPLDAELAAARATLRAGLLAGDAVPADPMPAAGADALFRATAAELAHRAAAGLVVATGSRALRLDEHAQRLAREALFLLVFGSRPAIRTALLGRLRSS